MEQGLDVRHPFGLGTVARRLNTGKPFPAHRRTHPMGSRQMSQREATLLHLKDVLEHLRTCQQQLQWAEDAPTTRLLTETMLRDLDCCRRLCESLHRRTALLVG